jgi:N-terminal domain of reverse transcriptase
MIIYKEWTKIHWDRVQVFVYDLQNKIYCHAKMNKIGLVRHCQSKLVKSMEAKLLAIRSVSQGNRRKVTASSGRI